MATDDMYTSTDGESATSNGKGRFGGLMNRSKIIVCNLCTLRQFVTQASGSTVAPVLVGPVFYNYGPRVEDIVVHVLGRQFQSGFKYRLRMARSFDGESWSTAVELLGEQTSTGYVISSAYTTRTDFGKHLRFEVGLTDDSAVRSGVLSVDVAFKFWT